MPELKSTESSSVKKGEGYFSKTQEFFSSTWENLKQSEKTDEPPENSVILAANIARSARLYETLGDQQAQEVISACLFIFSKVGEHHSGKIIKTVGDQIICTFPKPHDALKAAKDMYLALRRMPALDDSDLVPPNIRAAIHMGTFIYKGNDIFGDGANVLIRIMEFAEQRQILVTDPVLEAMPDSPDTFRCIARGRSKSKDKGLGIHQLVWDPNSSSELQNSSISGMLKPPASHMELQFDAHLIEISQDRPRITIGRRNSNDLVVHDSRVSRTHARIEYRQGKFVLTDQSLNGTYLVMNKKPQILKGSEIYLEGKGIIGLARKVKNSSPEAIHFSVFLTKNKKSE
jgi:class 3 adenylate cyclase